MSVSTTPGATALTRIPRAPSIQAKCFTRVSTAPLVAAYAGSVPTTARAASDERKTMLLPLHMIGSSCCTRKNGARTLTANSLSKSSTVVSSMVAAFKTPALVNKDCQAFPDKAAALPGRLAGAVRGGKIRRYGIRSATGFAYLCDNTVGLLRAAAVMHEDLGAGLGERERAGAADAARS